MIRLIIVSFVFSLVLFSCHISEEKKPATQQNTNSNELLIKLTQEEYETARIKTAKPELKKIPDFIELPGFMKVPDEKMHAISPPFKGFIKKILHRTGTTVKKGEPIAILTHPEYLRLQEEYLITQAHLNFHKTNYSRQGELAVDKAGTLKEMEKAKALYEEYQTRFNSLKSQLEMLHIDPGSIHSDSLIKEITLYAPVSGIISTILRSPGELSDELHPVMKIADTRYLKPHFLIGKKEKYSLTPGKKIQICFSGGSKRTGRIDQPGSTQNSKTHAWVNLDQVPANTYPGEPVTGKSLRDSLLIPVVWQKSIVLFNHENWIFVQEEEGFKPLQVEVKNTYQDFVVIDKPDNIKGKKIVTGGANYLKKKLMEKQTKASQL